MQDSLKVAIIQSDLIWENPKENRISFEKKISTLKNIVDLIVLPEMFTTGFTMNAKEVAEKMNGTTVAWMKKVAKEKQAVILGSLVIMDDKKYYNRFIIAFPDGSLNHYDKRHLFSFAGEDKVYTQGNERIAFTYKDFKIAPLICYDLRFPVWARNTESIDVLIYIANWPKARIGAWDILLQARAIENMCYVIGVNRVGEDANKLKYTGHSAVNNYFGECLLHFNNEEDGIKIITLYKEDLTKTRDRFRFLDDRDVFTIQN